MGLPILLLCGNAGVGKDSVAEILRDRMGAVRVAQADTMKRLVKKLFGFSDEALWGPSAERERVVEVTPVNRDDSQLSDACRLFEDMCLNELGLGTAAPMRIKDATDAFKIWYHDQIVGGTTVEAIGEGRAMDGPIHSEYTEYKRVTHLAARAPLQTLGTEVVRDHLGATTWNRAALRTAQRLLEGGWTYAKEIGLRAAPGTPPARLVVITDGRFISEVIGAKQAGAKVALVMGRDATIGGVAGHRSEVELKTLPRTFFDVTIDNSGSMDALEFTVNQMIFGEFSPTAYGPAIGGGCCR